MYIYNIHCRHTYVLYPSWGHTSWACQKTDEGSESRISWTTASWELKLGSADRGPAVFMKRRLRIRLGLAEKSNKPQEYHFFAKVLTYFPHDKFRKSKFPIEVKFGVGSPEDTWYQLHCPIRYPSRGLTQKTVAIHWTSIFARRTSGIPAMPPSQVCQVRSEILNLVFWTACARTQMGSLLVFFLCFCFRFFLFRQVKVAFFLYFFFGIVVSAITLLAQEEKKGRNRQVGRQAGFSFVGWCMVSAAWQKIASKIRA